jgi:predicted NBD/HSP70 family sugar kinase
VTTTVAPSTARELRTASLLRLLRAVHDAQVPPTRAAVTRALGLGRGTATVLVAALKQRRLVAEADAGPRHGPGRPTARLVAHPDGPVVLAAAITYDGWTLDAVELGAGAVRTAEGGHDGERSAAVLDRIAREAQVVAAELSGRVGALALSVPATIHHGRIAQASRLGWREVDALGPFDPLGVPTTLLNDATAAGIAEVRRGAARGYEVVLHLHADAGIGGTLLLGGLPARDAYGAGGEFGHMPLAGGRDRCHCGAFGCWDLDVGTLALVGPDEKAPRRVAARILAKARDGKRGALERVANVATALGRGVGALVNAHDPELVTLSGNAATVAELADRAFRDAYLGALMRFRRAAPPPIAMSGLAGKGQRLGTAESAFDLLLTERLLQVR